MKVFGFPTSIRPGFWLFSALLVFFYPFPLGLWIAIAVAVFTLIHELGHAFAARAAGCRASIALDFMIAYASFEPARPLTWGQRARIAFAGPGLQMLVGTIALLAIGINPVSRGDITSTDVALAIWWSSIALGALNLVPILPLDGGAIVEAVVERVFPRRGRALVLKASIAITASILTIAIMTGFIGLIPITAFLLLMQYQTLAAPQKLRALLSDPSPSPQGNPVHDSMIVEALVASDQHARALTYARNAYAECPALTNALGAARAALSMNDTSLAVHWLSVAERSQIDSNELPRALAQTNFFDALKNAPGVSPQWFTN